MIVENIEPLQRALRQHQLATSRMRDFLRKYVELNGFICKECPDQPSLFAEWVEKRNALQDTFLEAIAITQADEPLEPPEV